MACCLLQLNISSISDLRKNQACYSSFSRYILHDQNSFLICFEIKANLVFYFPNYVLQVVFHNLQNPSMSYISQVQIVVHSWFIFGIIFQLFIISLTRTNLWIMNFVKNPCKIEICFWQGNDLHYLLELHNMACYLFQLNMSSISIFKKNQFSPQAFQVVLHILHYYKMWVQFSSPHSLTSEFNVFSLVLVHYNKWNHSKSNEITWHTRTPFVVVPHDQNWFLICFIIKENFLFYVPNCSWNFSYILFFKMLTCHIIFKCRLLFTNFSFNFLKVFFKLLLISLTMTDFWI